MLLNEHEPPQSYTLQHKVNMNAQIYGLMGMGIGVIGFLTGLGASRDFAGILIIGGIFIFGCGLIAAAIGAKK